ncbi:MAG TPA: hypothetical protein VFG42_11920 [Baekduia sp.]|uniref:hypothetical protein n=1 Tax=Baekduia sp. TaxID=2600305 RepID=UPI002D7657DD|nr:hypothetical protein [Baekduia sp.]HET6507485.1 hypothetical protein [Baekduia sp.]
MRLRPLALAAVIAGLLGGVVAAIAIPTTKVGIARGAAAAGPPAQVVPGVDTVAHVAPAAAPEGDVDLRPEGPVRIEARAADPLGGPDWAVRVFRAARVVRPGSRRPGVDPVIGHPLCAQVGRIHAGRFGWLTADGTFRPLRIGAQGGSVATCGSRKADMNGMPTLDTLSPITDPHAPAARAKSTVAWGVAGRGARRVTLKVAGRAVVPNRTPNNAYIIAVGPETDQREITGTATYADGRGHRLGGGLHHAPGIGGGASGRPVLAARAPDPNGGLPFAMTVSQGRDGTWCQGGGGRVVGGRVGGVDYARDILTENANTGGGTCGVRGPSLFKDHPVLLGWSGGGGDTAEEGGDTGGTGRIARRTQRGLMTFTGQAAPGVVAVTLETPRDVRTLIPSGPTRAIIAVYDGSFPTGSVKITARFKDGHVQTDRLPDVGM